MKNTLAQWPQTLSRRDMVAFVRTAGARYWPNGTYPPDDFIADVHLTSLGREWVDIDLPEQFAHLGVDGKLWIDAVAIANGKDNPDWYLAAFSHLSGIAEWHHELAHGVSHSFAFRLKNIPARCFDYAWANRIMLLLRAMETARVGKDETALFGALPAAEIRVTHDVDALDKTWPIRLKQTAFELFNALRFLMSIKLHHSVSAMKRAYRMAFTTHPYYHLDAMADMVAEHGLRSTFHIHVPAQQRSAKDWLMDPGYAIDDPRLKDFVARRSKEGFEFGLHPSFDTWKDAEALRVARQTMSHVLGIMPTKARQHWLRFSWRDTWRTQTVAGLTEDATLGFNDRTGFRTAAALQYHPWDFVKGNAHTIHATPMILMDSQFYSYQDMSDDARKAAIAALINEVRAVHGVATVLWHPHTLSPDYGWQQGFKDLLASITS